jgi:predicted nucleotidyltransferase
MYSVDWQRAERVWAAATNVITAWIFGSAQRGQIREKSDLDSLDERASLRADLQQALQFDDIDLLVLNEASPIVRFEAVSGQPVFCRDAGRRAEFASLTAREYEDEMAMLCRAMNDNV